MQTQGPRQPAPPEEPPARRPPVLGYARPPGHATAAPSGLQFLAGLLGYATAAGGLVFAAANLRFDALGVFFAYFTGVAALVLGGQWLRHHHGWEAFLPGVFLGIGLTCLVPPVALFFLCGFP